MLWFTIFFIGLVFYNSSEIEKTKVKTDNVFSSRYTLFDFTFTAKYFNTEKHCWNFENKKIVKDFYAIDWHFETPLSKRLMGNFAKWHNHFPWLFSKCK